jgi:branched-chain amino acid transport system substrate-binding protein
MFARLAAGHAVQYGRHVPRRVYASLPLSGPAGEAAADVLRGAELALEGRTGAGIELVALDTGGGEDREARAAAHARHAVEDADAIAYLGDFHSSEVARSAPVLSAAGVLQVTPSATWTALRGATLVRLMPDDQALAAGIAAWLARAGVERVLVVHDHDDGYGVPMGRMCAEAAAARGVAARTRPVWDHGEPLAPDVAGAQAVLYAGVAGSGAAGLWRDLHALDADLWLLGTDGVATARLARELAPGAAARTRFFTARRAPWGFYGHEAMTLVLDAVAAGEEDRQAVSRAARAMPERQGIIGAYAIDADGRTTGAADGRLAVAGGALVWDRLGAAAGGTGPPALSGTSRGT